MPSLEELAETVAKALARSYRRAARWTLRRLTDLFNLFKLVVVFVPLIFLISLFFELTYAAAWPTKLFGWFAVVACAVFFIWHVAESFRDTPDPAPESPYLWVICSALSFGMILVTVMAHHEFRSPVLSATQRCSAYVKNVMSAADHPRTSIEPGRSGGVWFRIKSTPAGAKDAETHLGMWAEGVHFTGLETVIDVACKTWRDSESATLNDASGAYVIDQDGRKYNLKRDTGDYSFFLGHRTVFGGEIYRWSLVFPRTSDALALNLKHPQFEDVHIQFVADAPPSPIPNILPAAPTPTIAAPSQLDHSEDQTPSEPPRKPAEPQNATVNAEEVPVEDERIYTAADGIVLPKPLSQPEPEYTERARANRIQGQVMLKMIISKDGKPETITVTHGIDEGLDRNAVETAKRWRFSPGTIEGRRVRVAAAIAVDFRLR